MDRATGPRRAGRVLPAGLIAAALGAALAAAGPPTADLAAQAFRADLGPGVLNERWFAGHHLPGYSLLSPPLMSALGPLVAGALATVALAVAGAALAGGGAAGAWLAVAAAAQLASGRVTFLVGAALGAGALLAAERGRRAPALVLGVLSGLGSPVAGAFLVLLAVARRRWALAAAAAAPAAAVLVLFPEGGTEPFAASAFWPALAMTAAVGTLVPGLRAVCALYALALVAAFALPTAMGGNATRLGMLAAGPALLAGARRGPAPWLLLAGAAWWVAYPAVRDVRRGADDPATARAFHAPLLAELGRRGLGGGRLEVPMTANHWEARWLAPAVPLARGWVRQLDRGRNPLFYDRPLDGARLRRWLDARAVRLVAVPDARVPLDEAGRGEARLVLAGAVPGVRQVWRGPGWRLFEVRGAPPIVTGAARLERVADGELVLRATRPGLAEVRAHWSRWRAVTAGAACAEPWPGDPARTRVRVTAPGTVVLGVRRAGGRCP